MGSTHVQDVAIGLDEDLDQLAQDGPLKGGIGSWGWQTLCPPEIARDIYFDD